VPPQTLGTGCTPLNVGGDCKGGGSHFTLEAPAPSGGTCAPVATQVVPPVTSGGRTHLCAPTTPPVVATCETGRVCAPAADPAFEAEARCILHTGAQQCPTEYPKPLTSYEGADTDNRACAPCTCGAPTGVACGNATVSFSIGPACSAGGSMTIAATSGCSALQGMESAALSGGSTASGGQCAPAGGQASGTVTLKATQTICCTP
jgi:hypothetical protein